MSSLLRHAGAPARMAPRIAKPSLLAASRSSYPLLLRPYRQARRPPAAAPLLRQSRFLYSTPRRLYSSSTSPPQPPPLPDGWKRLSPKDAEEFIKQLEVLESQSGLLNKLGSDEIPEFLRFCAACGAPAPFVDAMEAIASGSFSGGVMSIMRLYKSAGSLPDTFRDPAVQTYLLQMVEMGYYKPPPGSKFSSMFNTIKAQHAREHRRQGIEDSLKNAASAEGKKGSSQSPQSSAQQREQPDKPQEEHPKQPQSQENQQDQQQQPQGSDQPGNKGQSPGQPGKGKKAPEDMYEEISAGIVLALIVAIWYMLPSANPKEITWQELRRNFLDKGLVEKMIVRGNRVDVVLNSDATEAVYPDIKASNKVYYIMIASVDAFENRLEQAQNELGIPSSEHIPVVYHSSDSLLASILINFGPTLLLVGLLAWLSRRAGNASSGSNGVFGFGKSRAKRFSHESAVKVKFADVAGADEAKVEIMEFVSFLKNPQRFERLGAKIPRGAILSGPPGTGKTLLAKATAGESEVPFYSVSGSEFVEMFVGVGASRVRDLFATARKNAPCIIFIDEIDAIGKSRGDGKRNFGGNDEREATLNQILTEMDGFNTTEQVVVLAGTNRPDTLDKALLRPGRFDRHIVIDRPTMKGRADIFRVHLKNIPTDVDMEYLCGRLAALTPGFAGADIANAVNEAALIAARADAEKVGMIHFEQAIERVIGGLERKSLVLSKEEKRTVAYHEAGHAVCGWYFQWADPLLKVSIIPRGQGALGYAQYLPSGDAYLMSTNQLMDRMAMTLGGRISEELHFPTVTTGASDDFRKVTMMATTMVTQWGMSPKLGPLHFNNDPNQIQKPFAEATAQTIDAEVRRIVDEAYKQCRELLEKRKKEIGLVAEELLRKEVLTRDDLVRLLGPREWPDKEEFSKYFDGNAPPNMTENTDEAPPAQ